MKIAYLIPEYPHPETKHSGGLGTSIKNLTEALAKQGIDVTVFVYGQNKQTIIDTENLKIHLIQNKSYLFGGWIFYRKYVQNYVAKHIKKNSIELLEVPDYTGISAFMNFKIPVVMRIHGSDAFFCHLELRPQKLKNYLFEKIALRAVKNIIAPNEFSAKLTAKIFGINLNKITCIPLGINLEVFENDEPKNYQKGLILYLGTIIRKKGVLTIPNIFWEVQKKHPKASLVFIGADTVDPQSKTSTWEMIQTKLEHLGLKNYRYLGALPYHQIKNYIKQAEVCIFPSFAETTGLVALEFMAMQKPVVFADYPWAHEIIIDGVNGFLENPENGQQYAQKINQLLENYALKNAIACEAKKTIEDKFDIKSISVKQINFYEKLIRESL